MTTKQDFFTYLALKEQRDLLDAEIDKMGHIKSRLLYVLKAIDRRCPAIFRTPHYIAEAELSGVDEARQVFIVEWAANDILGQYEMPFDFAEGDAALTKFIDDEERKMKEESERRNAEIDAKFKKELQRKEIKVYRLLQEKYGHLSPAQLEAAEGSADGHETSN